MQDMAERNRAQMQTADLSMNSPTVEGGTVVKDLTVSGYLIVKDSKDEHKKTSKWVKRAAAAAATMVITVGGFGAGFRKANAEKVSPTLSSVVSGEVSKDSALSAEVVVDEEYIQETVRQFMDFDAPLPVERTNNCIEAWKIKTFEGYKNEFREKGQNDEYWLNVGARGLYAFDNKEDYMGPEGGFVNYVSREEFFNEIVTGNAENYFCDDEGHPLSRLVNFTDKMKEGLIAGVKKLEKAGVNNLYEAWRESGACIFYAGKVDSNPGASISIVNQWGVIAFNMTEDNIEKANLDNIFATRLGELVSVVNFQVTKALELNTVDGITGLNWSGYNDSIKYFIYGNLLIGSNDEDLNRFGESLLKGAKAKADEYNLSMDSDLYKRLVELTLAVIEIPGEKFLVNGK
jgi:hypothetical protein